MFRTRALIDAFLTVVGVARNAFEGVAFWSAVVLPLVYLPSMALPGVVPLSEEAVVSVVGIHVLALVVGHRHDVQNDGRELGVDGRE